MSKVVTVSDTHGVNRWVCPEFIDALKHYKVDHVVFLGDYFDNWDNDWTKNNQIDNFNFIVDYAKKVGNFKICIGNHDIAYLSKTREGQSCSGHQWGYHADIEKALVDALPYLNIAYKIDNCIFSHGGISGKWLPHFYARYKNHIQDPMPECPIAAMNDAFHKGFYNFFEWTGGESMSYSGNGSSEGPLWIRPPALCGDKWIPYNKFQVVGHTEVPHIEGKYEPFLSYKGKHLLMADTPSHDRYFEVDTKKKKVLDFLSRVEIPVVDETKNTFIDDNMPKDMLLNLWMNL